MEITKYVGEAVEAGEIIRTSLRDHRKSSLNNSQRKRKSQNSLSEAGKHHSSASNYFQLPSQSPHLSPTFLFLHSLCCLSLPDYAVDICLLCLPKANPICAPLSSLFWGKKKKRRSSHSASFASLDPWLP